MYFLFLEGQAAYVWNNTAIEGVEKLCLFSLRKEKPEESLTKNMMT